MAYFYWCLGWGKDWKMPVTLKDIAKRTGKSIPTVSRALGGFEDISPTTRAEVQRVAREMGYVPNATALNLRKKRTNTLALILPSTRNLRFSDPFFSDFVSGVVEQAALLNFNIHISYHTLEDERQTYLNHIRSHSADGYILMRTQRQDARIELLQEMNVPFVAFGRTDGDNDFYLVDEDGRGAVHQLVNHLAGLGHTRMGFIAEPQLYTKAYHRLQGFIDGLKSNGLPVIEELIVETRFRQPSGRSGAHHLLGLEQPPSAIVTCNDLIAFGAISEARELGLVVGRDVSITGFDDILLAEFASPPLTTVHLPGSELGMLVTEKLVRVITDGTFEPKHTILQPQIIIRQSTGPVS
jgi:LacI family transcriptional regulator